ncbi:MAG: TlpA family protein disulfide reductase [Bryobacterales bacterium]|nr:TlpA family protein disulfide reductase [Bryobacterales bacterium]
MRALTVPSLIVTSVISSAASLWAAEVPRPSPDFAIQLTDGKQVKVSDYRGKVLCLAFILTTCPHCQKTTQLLDGIYKDLEPKGFEVLEAAVNENPGIPNFIAQFKVPFPVGTAGVMPALDYIQWPKDKRPLVPFLVFIDRKGVIRAQYTGVDEAFFNDQQEQHMRDEVEKLLSESGSGKAKATHKTPTS